MFHLRTEDPGVVEVVLASLNQQNLQVMVQVCKAGLVSSRLRFRNLPSFSSVLSSHLSPCFLLGRLGGGHLGTYRPATTQPQLPPPQTIMSNSSGRELWNFEYCGAAMIAIDT